MTVTGGTALNATTSGTFTVTGAANTLSSTTGAAQNVANVTIGAGGLTFQSISASGGTSGIILNGTGAGFFTVTGNSSGNGGGTITLNAPGTAATFTAPVLADLTGGTIQNSTGVGISLTNVGTVSLTRMQLRNSGTDGISLSGATGFTLDHSFVTDNTGAITHEGMRLSNCSGTMNITNSTVGPAAHDCILLDNLNVNMAAFNLTSSVIQDTRSIGTANGFLGNDGLLIQMRGTSVLTSGQVTGCVFTNDFGTGLHVLTSETARIGSASAGVITAPAASNSFTVQTSTFTSNGVGVDISQNDTSNEAFQILNNTVIGRLTAPNAVASSSSPTAINTFTAAGASTGPASHFHVGKIDGNFIGTQGVKDSGSGFGNGIRAVVQGGNTQGVVAISNNTVREVPNQTVINIIGQNGAGVTGTGTARFKVTGNTMPQVTGSNLSLGGPANTAIAEAGIFVLADEDFIVTTVITGNTIYDVTTMSGTFDIYFAQRDGPPANSQLRTEGTGSVSAFILGNNTLAGGSKFIDEGAGSGNPTALVAPGSAGAYPLLVAPGGVERSAARMALADTGDTLSVAKGAKTWVKVAIPVTERAIPPVGKPVPSAVGTMPAPAITQSDLDATVSAALARWEAAGLTGGQVARLRALRFEAATLSDLHLGEADGALIRVDGNAGDNGWFIDPTPLDDAEFASHITGPRRYTDPDGAPAGRMDLLTAILHEMGHALGLDDTYLETHRDALMYGFLTKGERRLPTHRDAVAAAMLGAVPHAHAHFLSAPLTIGTLPPGKMVTVKYAVTITGAVPSISNQGTVSGSNFANVLTDDPTVGGAADATVTPVELPPTVSNVAVSTNEDTTLTFTAANFTGSYSDPNGDALATVRITSLPANGVLKNGAAVVAAVPADLALASIGSLTYVPNANVSGADSFGWNGADGTLFATTGATVNINVIAVNDAPVLAGIESVALPYTENAAATAITGTLTVAEPRERDGADHGRLCQWAGLARVHQSARHHRRLHARDGADDFERQRESRKLPDRPARRDLPQPERQPADLPAHRHFPRGRRRLAEQPEQPGDAQHRRHRGQRRAGHHRAESGRHARGHGARHRLRRPAGDRPGQRLPGGFHSHRRERHQLHPRRQHHHAREQFQRRADRAGDGQRRHRQQQFLQPPGHRDPGE